MLPRVALLFALLVPACAWPQAGGQPHGLPHDWSHHHVIIKNPDTESEASAKGKAAHAAWLKRMATDPRFAAAVARKTAWVQPVRGQAFAGRQLARANHPPPGRRAPPPATGHRDWNAMLGPAGGGKQGVFPAKFSFDIDATPSCDTDYVVYSTGAAGAQSTGSPTVIDLALIGSPPPVGRRINISRTLTDASTGKPATWLMWVISSDTSNTGVEYLVSADPATSLRNLADALNRNGAAVGVSATFSGNRVSVTSLLTGANTSTFRVTSSHPGIFNISTAAAGSGSPGQATIQAFNRLYSVCSDPTSALGVASGATPGRPTPSVYWAYDTSIASGSPATADLSPVLSFDGTQVAFMQRAAGTASLVLLKWSPQGGGTVGAPVVPVLVSRASDYRSCNAPCMYAIALGADDTNSSPGYDYWSDTMWVGDDAGRLHKFTGVFQGTPAEVAGGGFPAQVLGGAYKLTSPMYDDATRRVFVGSDFSGGWAGGRLHAVSADTGAVATTGPLGAPVISSTGLTPTGVQDAVMLDRDARQAYVFVESAVATPSLNCGDANILAECKAVFQIPTDFLDGFAPDLATQAVALGLGTDATRHLFAGMFDNAYVTSATSQSPSGYLYVCGSAGVGGARVVSGPSSDSAYPTLFRIPINGNRMGTPEMGPVLVQDLPSKPSSGRAGDCSPITTVVNAGQEYLFVSVSKPLGGDVCLGTGSCTVSAFNLTTATSTWGAATTPVATLSVMGGTGGIVIDNVSPIAGTSQIYFATLGDYARRYPDGAILPAAGTAVQASQTGLQ